MEDPIRHILVTAIRAARYGAADPAIERAVTVGNSALRIEQLNFDSLAWMEFCISVELQSGHELTPADVQGMNRVSEIEDWLRARNA
jgi:hypothetical protein